MKKNIFSSVLIIPLLLMWSVSLVGCSTTNSTTNTSTGGTTSSASSNKPTTLNLAEAADYKSLDASQAGDGPTVRVAQFLYSGLLRYEGKNNNELAPALAEAMPKWSTDNMSVTFKLRQGTKFSDGSPLTADDVGFTFTRLLDPKTKSPYQGSFTLIKGAKEFIDGKATTVAGIVVVDPQTIRFDLSTTVPFFLNYLGMPVSGIVSKEQVERYKDAYGEHPLGAGPYMLEKWTRGQELVMTKNPNYYLTGLPKINNVNVKLGVADNVKLMMVQQGDLDLVAPVQSADYPTVQNDPNLKSNYHSKEGPRLYYLGMNVEMKPFDNRLVRQAMNYAINKDNLVQLLNGRAQIMGGTIPPWVPGYDESLKPYPYDPEKAKQLLAEGGYPNGFPIDLLVPEYFDNPKIGQAVQTDLAKVGVKVSITQQTMPVFTATVKQKGKVAMFLRQWTTDFPDAQNVLSMMFHGSKAGSANLTWYNNPDVNKLLDEADSTMDQTKRIDLYRQADRIIHDDAPWVFEVYAKADGVMSPRLQPTPDSFGRVPVEGMEFHHFDAVVKKQ